MRYISGFNVPLPDEFSEVLSALRDLFSEPTTINIGQARILDLAEKLTVTWGMEYLSGYPNRFTDHQAWLTGYQDWFLLPLSNDDYAAVLESCYELQQIGKLDIQASMKVVILPEAFFEAESRELPFEIQLEVLVSLCLPSLFEPLSKRPPKRRTTQIESLSKKLPRNHTTQIETYQSHLYDFLYGRSVGQDSIIHHDIDIPYFYSILTSASPICSQLADNAMQPDTLLPNLLPFQRRSVAWLLGREGKKVTSEGVIVPINDNAEYTFWDEIQEGNHTFFYNRLSRMLYMEKPATEKALGGILAEEPGLGKTLETLSLILLNPAPEDRNPALIRWDPETRLDVKAVKTTLIVTPSSLAGQWVDEISAHAPSLKVLVYEGWSKLAVPIKNTAEEKDRVRKLLRQQKSKSKTKRGKASGLKGRDRKRKGKAKQSYDSTESELTEVMPDEEEEEDNLDWCTYVQQYDVVITTYAVLRSDFNVARAAIQRPRREDVSYPNVDRPRSPLVMVEWMRVVMDEVQMVGGGKTEDMVSLIPRLASFAVSGTPARSHVSDLSHVLKFLRVDNLIGSPRMWNELLQPRNAGEFAAFFQKYAIRTIKTDIKAELTIPQQTRYVVGIELGPIEREVYDQTLMVMLDGLGLDARGIGASAGWQVDVALLRSSLRRLRAICTHPQVGQLQRQGDKMIKPGALKTMEAVLEDLKDKNWKLTMDDAKAKVQGLCVLAQYQQQTQDPTRYQTALQTLQTAEREVDRLIQELQAAIQEHNERGKAFKNRASTSSRGDDDEGNVEHGKSQKGKERERSPGPDDDDDDDDDDGDDDDASVMAAAAEEHTIKLRALQQRLKEARLVLHRVKFLQGDVHHVLGDQHAASEIQAYGIADEIRRDLLKGAEEDAGRIMQTLSIGRTRTGRDGVSAPDLLIEVPFLGDDCKTQKLWEFVDEAHRIIEEILNEQSALLWEWRAHIIELLSQRLNPGEGEADGQEYQRTLDNQGEAEVYLQLYAALLADRREALLHERTLLAAHDGREKKLRTTVAAMRAMDVFDEPELEAHNDVDFQPEHEVVHKELSDKRKGILKNLGSKALRTVAIDLHGVAAAIKNDKDPEKLWAKDASSQLRRLISEQETLHDKLDADLALMRKAFNQRIIYFRQLQEISDSVIQAEWDGSIDESIAEEVAKHKQLDVKILAGRSRQRYLANLVQNKGKMDEDDDDDTCTLCKCEFVRGYITPCAHIFCEGCMQAWMAKKDGRTCPMCRVVLESNALQRFTVGLVPEQKAQSNGEGVPHSRREIMYNTIHPEIFEAIQQVEARGNLGSKVQTLVKHLLYLQNNEPGSKSIVFSAWADSLHSTQKSLRSLLRIRSLRIDQNSKGDSAAKVFRKDPTISVLLLHGERENAGLNLTCASRVFLLESVVHHGFELQAIARIDRLGQTRPTEVYCYYAENTVERNILDLAARQGLSLYTKDRAAGTLNISSFELDDAKRVIDSPTKKRVQKGDFIFQVDDMLAILFPHMYEDVEYLLPDEAQVNETNDVVMGSSEHTGSGSGSQINGTQRTGRPKQNNAVAGPSRLR
ncbi:hypothetical protein P691DRAFT_671107 [Macrolepiota fuliginosa MF-IS2]|uniref:RING-type domain-containing protein n=1 Tax=Macrolepiota fuliginosa MF-IS2 TaxID=1400762 RepID=A0A9P6C3U5_9AGAR|nr:hypothetical protein P691DRAFT_671107 [Macrolepiota fuliginosa MF-IS2]